MQMTTAQNTQLLSMPLKMLSSAHIRQVTDAGHTVVEFARMEEVKELQPHEGVEHNRAAHAIIVV